MIRTAIKRRLIELHIGYTTLSDMAGVPFNTLRRFANNEIGIDYDDMIKCFKCLGLSIGFKQVGTSVTQPEQIRHKIRGILSTRNIKVRDLAIFCSINYCTLSSWLNGKRQIQSIYFEKILVSLNMGIYPIS